MGSLVKQGAGQLLFKAADQPHSDRGRSYWLKAGSNLVTQSVTINGGALLCVIPVLESNLWALNTDVILGSVTPAQEPKQWYLVVSEPEAVCHSRS